MTKPTNLAQSNLEPKTKKQTGDWHNDKNAQKGKRGYE